METGLILRWGFPKAGREDAAEGLFEQSVGYFGDLLAKEKITFFEPFLYRTGEAGGFAVVKGEQAEISEIVTSEPFLTFVSKAHYVVDDFRVDYAWVGQEIPEVMSLGAKARVDLGLVH